MHKDWFEYFTEYALVVVLANAIYLITYLSVNLFLYGIISK